MGSTLASGCRGRGRPRGGLDLAGRLRVAFAAAELEAAAGALPRPVAPLHHRAAPPARLAFAHPPSVRAAPDTSGAGTTRDSPRPCPAGAWPEEGAGKRQVDTIAGARRRSSAG